MSRLKDLEDSIRQSYELIRTLEEKIRLSNEPQERARAERDSAQQWDLIRGYWTEYFTLCRRQGQAPADDILQICARFVPPAEEQHIPLLVVVDDPKPGMEALWQSLFQAMERWHFAPERFQRDFGIGRADLVLHHAARLPDDRPEEWLAFVRQFRQRLQQISSQIPGNKTLHIFFYGPAALGVGLGAAMGTLFQPVIYQHFAPQNHPVIDFYTLTQTNRRGVHVLEEPVQGEFRFVRPEGDPGEAPTAYVSMQLSGPDIRGQVEAEVRRQEECGEQRGGIVHIVRREERFLDPQDDWLLCAREILTTIQSIVSSAHRERVHLFLSAPVALAVALGLGLKYFRPLTVWQWSPQDQRYYPVLPLEQLGRTAS